jgi:hypothetical protein
MAPSIVHIAPRATSELSVNPVEGKDIDAKGWLKDTLRSAGLLKEALRSTGSLDSFPHDDLTPSTGTEFTSATQLSALLKAPNADQLIRDLAILSTFFPLDPLPSGVSLTEDSISKMCGSIP